MFLIQVRLTRLRPPVDQNLCAHNLLGKDTARRAPAHVCPRLSSFATSEAFPPNIFIQQSLGREISDMLFSNNLRPFIKYERDVRRNEYYGNFVAQWVYTNYLKYRHIWVHTSKYTPREGLKWSLAIPWVITVRGHFLFNNLRPNRSVEKGGRQNQAGRPYLFNNPLSYRLLNM